MISITPADSHYSKELRELLRSEWEEIDPFEGHHKNFQIPLPLIAIEEQTKLVGGLSFTSFANPKREELALWINALLVVPEYRRLGIASKLIAKAEREASSLGFQEMFVQTEFSSLYQLLNWTVCKTNKNGAVLSKVLPDVQARTPTTDA